jgi:uncharacterized protein with PIN domain
MKGNVLFRFSKDLSALVKGGHAEFSYAFQERQSLKDALESMGIPHTEVGYIEIDGSPTGLDMRPTAGATVRVSGHQRQQAPKGFVADVHLGALVRLLRMLGFDVLYDKDLNEQQLLTAALQSGKVLLSRGRRIFQHKLLSYGCLIHSEAPQEQLQQVLQRFQLQNKLKPFSRCIICNCELVAVRKEAVVTQLLEQTNASFNEFWQCTCCKRVYWKGSHFYKMQRFIEEKLQLSDHSM